MLSSGKKPELLAPCGSPEALDAAIAAGADAVYFGGSSFNARMNAANFGGDSLSEAIRKCRCFGVKTNITLNTLLHSRELPEVLKYVEKLYRLGADALIVADIGAAHLIHEEFPDFELHASTQMAGHCLSAAEELSKLGFSRMVAARELSELDLSTLCSKSPIETEIFIHGAICVSQSGQCLASSLIGGRSGNRGECAQPCRLPYSKCGCRQSSYPLSLKDMCLAGHISKLCRMGAASFKIEGRMKSPEYVYGVTKIYRRLIDEERDAEPIEIAELADLFSRSGFTDGYYTGKINRSMLGIRTDADKSKSRSSESFNYAKLCDNSRRRIRLSVSIKTDRPSELTVTAGDITFTVSGEVPDTALTRPLTEADVKKSMEKFGGTPFVPSEISVDIDDGLILPISSMNRLRREAVDKLIGILCRERSADVANLKANFAGFSDKPDVIDSDPAEPNPAEPSLQGQSSKIVSARFDSYRSIPDTLPFDIVYIPLEEFEPYMTDKVNGLILPPVIFDSERESISEMLKKAAESGIAHLLVSNIGHLSLAKENGMVPHGDFRLNIYNRYSFLTLRKMGFADTIASPELTLPQLRDLRLPAVVYGRLPLMVLEKCAIRELYSCDECRQKGFLPIRDRMNVDFPLRRAWKHRNILYNSLPLYMADRRSDIDRAFGKYGEHYIFSDETASQAEAVIRAYENQLPTKNKIRRISK